MKIWWRCVDRSETMDLYDYHQLQECFSGDGVSYEGWPCLVFDVDEDGDIDLDDWAVFDAGTNMTGPVAP